MPPTFLNEGQLRIIKGSMMSLSGNMEARALLRGAFGLVDVLWARYRQQRPRTLPTLLLFTTYRCNLRCAMCGVRHQPDGRELDIDDYRNILDAAHTLRTSLMLISGGEALTRGDLVYEVVRMGRERGIAAHLCSNGLLINEHTAGRLQQVGVRSISISLESHERETHERIRGAGSFDPAVTALRALTTHAPDIRTGINCTVSAINYRGLAEMVPFAESLGVDQLKFAPFHTNLLHREKPAAEFDALGFSEDQFEDLEHEMGLVIDALRRARLLANHPRYLALLAASLKTSLPFRCYAGYAACTVDPYGNVSPCPDLDIGLNVREQPLDVIWRGDAYQRLRERVCACGIRCWDPLYTELSLRLEPGSLWQSVWRRRRELRFYYGGKRQ